MIVHPRIVAEIQRHPLMAEPGAALDWINALKPRLFGSQVTVFMPEREAGVAGDPIRRQMNRAEGWMDARPIGDSGVAVLEIEGALVPKGKWSGMYCGETSYEWIGAAADAALENEAVKGVIYEVDSYGGSVAGAFDCAARLKRLSDAKPTMAVLTDSACSGGYLLASQARTIVAPATGDIGSIGVIMLHFDFSRMADEEGVTITPIFSGARKNDFSPFAPLPEDVAARARERIDRDRNRFADTVAAARGPRLTRQAALATEAEVFPADEALAAGLIDAIAHPHEAVAAFVDEIGALR